MRGIKLYLILLDFDQRGISSAKEMALGLVWIYFIVLFDVGPV